MQADWDIKSRSHVCSKTGREFNEGEFFYTLLLRDGEGFRREDLSEEAWKERNENIQPFSFWRTKYEPPAPPPPEPMKRDDAESLLRRLIEENNPIHMMVYEHVATGETIVISNPHLNFDQIPEIQREVSMMLAPQA